MLLLCDVCCQIEVSATARSLVQRSATEWDVSESDTKTATMMRPRPTRAVEPWKKKSLISYTTSLISLSLNKLEKFRVIVCCLCFPTHYFMSSQFHDSRCCVKCGSKTWQWFLLTFSEKNSLSPDFCFVNTLHLLLSCMSSTDHYLWKIFINLSSSL